MIETHIPQGESLNVAACEQSFQMVVDFYKKYFPQFPADYFLCDSRLLNPNLAEILDEKSVD